MGTSEVVLGMNGGGIEPHSFEDENTGSTRPSSTNAPQNGAPVEDLQAKHSAQQSQREQIQLMTVAFENAERAKLHYPERLMLDAIFPKRPFASALANYIRLEEEKGHAAREKAISLEGQKG